MQTDQRFGFELPDKPTITTICLGREVEQRRQAKGLTQPELAEKAEIDQSHLERLEAGNLSPRDIPTHVAGRLASALDVSNFDVHLWWC